MEPSIPSSRLHLLFVAAALAVPLATGAAAEPIDSARIATAGMSGLGGIGWRPDSVLAGPATAGGKGRGSLAGSTELPYLGGVNVALDYAGQAGGVGAKTRLSKAIDGAKLTWTSSLDGRLDGLGIGGHMNEGSLDWSSAPLPMSFGLREATAADGSRNEVFRTTQTLSRAFGTFRNSTEIAVGGASADKASGTFKFARPVGSFGLLAQLDYRGTASLQPSAARVGFERGVDRGWSIYLDADRRLDGSRDGRVDFGASRRIGSVMAGPVAGAAADGNAYVGARLWIPLSPGGRLERWVGLRRS